MKDNAEILKLRVLLCFWKLSPADRSVTGIARTLGKEKYAVSRAVSSLEKDGLVQRENARSPQLTEAGRQAAQPLFRAVRDRAEPSFVRRCRSGKCQAGRVRLDALLHRQHHGNGTGDRGTIPGEIRASRAEAVQRRGAVQKTEGRLLFAAVSDLPRAHQGRQQPFHGERGLRAPLQPVCERR